MWNRLPAIPALLTLTVLICFWSVEISVGVFLLLLPFYLLPTPAGSRTAPAPG